VDANSELADRTVGDLPIKIARGFALPAEAVTETFAILANRGAGKSVTAHRLVEQMYRTGLPVVVLDVKGDWWGIRSSASGKGPGLPFVIFGGDHADVPLEPTAGELIADLIVDDRIPAVLDMSSMSKTKARSFATAFAERLYTRNRDALHVVIEEADVLIPQRASADTARLLGAMEDIAKRGRSRGLGLTVVTQRPQEVAKSVLELMETVILLRMTGPRSIKAAQDWISVNAGDDETASRDVVASLPSLQTGEAWVWSPAFLRLLKRVNITKFDTFDSHATPKPGETRTIPKTRADIDLEKLGHEIAATVQRAKENDPKTLRSRTAALQAQLTRTESERDVLVRDNESLRARIAELQADRTPVVPQDISGTINAAVKLLQKVLDDSKNSDGRPRPAVAAVPIARTPPTPKTRPAPQQQTGEVKFRAGAQRMLESLGRMAPLRLTKAQWGTVAKMKHTSGTFSTYLGELRRAGLIEEDSVGFSLTEQGFDYLGGRPEPMSGEELQQHYLTILRAGASRMLQAIMDAYPSGLEKEEISAQIDIVASSGTFSTYLGELRRNGLIEQHGCEFTASDILMQGAAVA
jgi:hypothetical protein